MACILLTDLFATSRGGYACPLEATCDELAAAAEAHGLSIVVHSFSELLPGQSLREHAAAAMDPPGSSQSAIGPWDEVCTGIGNCGMASVESRMHTAHIN